MSEQDIPPGPAAFGPEDEADLAAAEHVLGLDGAEARVAATARVAADPGFAAAVAAWERRFEPLFDEAPSVEPSAALWDRIAAITDPGARVVAFPPRRPVWDRVGPWRIATAASLAAAAALLWVLIERPAPKPAPPAPTAPLLVATLTAPDGHALFVATLDPVRRAATVAPVGPAGGPGRSPELWIIPAGGKPRAIGLVNAKRTARIDLPGGAMADAAGGKAILAVSLEPPGGSPTGAPTGPVVATGALATL
jgi:anti-sigma-K factor RskA